MLLLFLPLLLVAPVQIKAVFLPQDWTSGFTSPVTFASAGTNATCVAGIVKVTVTSNNIKLPFTEPVDQLSATELIVEMLQANPTTAHSTNSAVSPITGTYSIYSQLCFPADHSQAKKVQTIQFLTHGDTLDSRYWNIAPGYSYVDAAAEAGYATFFYDRIGVGQSEHPDPIQVVQGPLQVEIAHALIQLIRSGRIGGHSFKTFVGVGHSAGSTVTQAVTTKYPKDFDAVILSGTSTLVTYVATALASFDFEIANTDPSGRFKGLANGYLTQSTPQAIQFAFYRYPNFDPDSECSISCSSHSFDSKAVFNSQVADKQTNSLGELFTLGTIVSPSPQFTGPVDVLLGERDYVFCGGDCNYPSDQSALITPAFYPAASKGSQHYLVPGAGHVINAHYSAPQAFAQMTAFLKSNEIV